MEPAITVPMSALPRRISIVGDPAVTIAESLGRRAPRNTAGVPMIEMRLALLVAIATTLIPESLAPEEFVDEVNRAAKQLGPYSGDALAELVADEYERQARANQETDA